MATLDDVLNEIGRHENGGVRTEGPMTQHAMAQSDRLDAWSEEDHPRGKGGQFANSAAGKALTGYSTGALSVSERAPGKESRGYSNAAHEATQRALGSDRQEHHTEAERAHRAAAESHVKSGREHRNAAGNPNEQHGVAATLHGTAAAAHRERLEKLWKAGKPNARSDSTDNRLDAIVADCDDYERRYEQGDSVRHDEHIGWNAMVRKLQGEGHSKESAEKIAGYINKKKFG